MQIFADSLVGDSLQSTPCVFATAACNLGFLRQISAWHQSEGYSYRQPNPLW